MRLLSTLGILIPFSIFYQMHPFEFCQFFTDSARLKSVAFQARQETLQEEAPVKDLKPIIEVSK